ncbi:hypothetical protein HNR00_004991 [Methylorubrum rhodinum]|uniref:Uncharacterized protein n=1 Tax=Methylorubrum rhodinum TaxID=29428 RepID=A0A840ZPP1_9HYPH|nr:hypothetical protein [Methylorubrum rhodinum]MBB5760242.1 hypothetical protein [Methylorubrum rhodinum]
MADSYVVNFEVGSCEVSGYLLLQPFRLNALGELQPITGEAKLLVQIHWIKPKDGKFPSYSGQVPQRTRIKISDPKTNTILEISDVSAETVVSSQSVDVGTALWLFNAVEGSSVSFTPQETRSHNLKGGSGYFPWQGTLRGSGQGSSNRINVTYAEGVYNVAQDGTLREFAVLGPANVDGSGTFFNLIAGAQPNQTLPSVQFEDGARKKTLDFFGPDAGASQMAGAEGAVFAFNGIFKKGQPADLLQLIRDLSIPQDAANAPVSIWTEAAWRESLLFRDIAQSIEATSMTSAAKAASFAIADSDFEGLLLKGLRSRGGPAATML